MHLVPRQTHLFCMGFFHKILKDRLKHVRFFPIYKGLVDERELAVSALRMRE